MADASHELKTPLTVILTNTGILLRHPEQTVAQQRKWVEYIREEAQRMRELVEDLLFLARHDAGRDQAPAQTVDLAELLWSALLPFEPVAFEQGVTLESGIQSGVTVRGRSEELRRLAAILLDNAVKYAGPQGQVRVALARGDILKHVWGAGYTGEEKIVDVNIRRLRMKVEEEPSNPRHIVTVWGLGYRWDE